MSSPDHYQGIIHRYRDQLPIDKDTKVISLCEGNTPLIPLTKIPALIQRKATLFAKFEGLNPTGSFKDRGMTMAVTQAVSEGSKAVICASTGNTSASAAAYAARASIAAFVLIPEGKIAMGKLAQAMIHGATVLQIKGNFDDGMQLVKEIGETTPISVVNSINPFRIQGQKTIAFEIIDSLGEAPDYHCLPVGNAGNITAHWMGYKEYQKLGKSKNLPVMAGYQAAGAAPFVKGKMIDNPETVATAIRIGRPQSWDSAINAQRESGGWFDAFTDEEILETQQLLANVEGLFCEPASAVSVAGAIRDLKNGKIPEGSSVVCTLTGNGLKDPDIAISHAPAPTVIEPVKSIIEQAILSRIDHT